MKFTAYKITNTVNGKAYVGITKANLKRRTPDNLYGKACKACALERSRLQHQKGV